MDAVAGERRITYDARGLVEPDDTVPRVSEIDGERAQFDAKDLTTRQINLELRRLLYEEGVKDVTVLNPGAKHSLGVGILTRCRLNFDGTVVEVVVQRKSKPEDGYVRMGLIQVRDLTKPEKVKASWWPTKRPISGTDNTASVVFGGFVLVLFCGMALPGLGDRLGTSDRIQNAFRWCLTSASSQLDDWTR